MGNFDSSQPTEEQMSALIRLVKELSVRYKIPKKNIMGHGDVPFGSMEWGDQGIHVSYKKGRTAQTNCPGRYFPEKTIPASD